jgi:hypothetical protein
VEAKYILAVVSLAFLTAGGGRLVRNRGALSAQCRTWLLVGVIFGLVSLWLFTR